MMLMDEVPYFCCQNMWFVCLPLGLVWQKNHDKGLSKLQTTLAASNSRFYAAFSVIKKNLINSHHIKKTNQASWIHTHSKNDLAHLHFTKAVQKTLRKQTWPWHHIQTSFPCHIPFWPRQKKHGSLILVWHFCFFSVQKHQSCNMALYQKQPLTAGLLILFSVTWNKS